MCQKVVEPYNPSFLISATVFTTKHPKIQYKNKLLIIVKYNKFARLNSPLNNPKS